MGVLDYQGTSHTYVGNLDAKFDKGSFFRLYIALSMCLTLKRVVLLKNAFETLIPSLTSPCSACQFRWCSYHMISHASDLVS